MKTLHWLLPFALFALPGCGPAPTDPTEDAGTDVPPANGDPSGLAYKPCEPAQRMGQFTAENLEGYTSVQGRVLNGVVPSTVRKVEATEGQCRLLLGRSLFCNPTCGSSQTCGENGACIPYPLSQNVGTVSVSGMNMPLTMTPAGTAKYYSSAATKLPFPAINDGASLQLTASGADLPAFTLRGQGVSNLQVPEAPIALERGKPASLTWTPSTAASAARIHVVLDLAHHGGIAASVECDDIPDTGSFSIPATLVSKLMDQGLAGFPKVLIDRRTADSAPLGSGCVELIVQSQVSREVHIAGLVSCSTDEDCPSGQTCKADLTCSGTTTPPSSPVDSGTPDSGTSKPDSGTSTPDSGTSTPDSGTSTPDSGTPDSGTSTPDSGTGTPDSGSPVDSGTPDSGTGRPDSGTPDSGTGTPDSGTPDSGTVDSGTPVPTAPFSFFVTSLEAMRQLSGSQNGFGGDLRFGEATGLEGADKICRTIAETSMPGSSAKVWRAFLSASTGPNGVAVNAIDRIGEGPWYDRNGRIMAQNKSGLLTSRPSGGDATIKNDLPNEWGIPNHQGVDNHDVLTGSTKAGRFSGTRANTCNDWTSSVGTTGKPACGHSWPRGGSSTSHWLYDHTVPGCAPGVNLNDNGGGAPGDTTVGGAGGYGAIYCFALTP